MFAWQIPKMRRFVLDLRELFLHTQAALATGMDCMEYDEWPFYTQIERPKQPRE